MRIDLQECLACPDCGADIRRNGGWQCTGCGRQFSAHGEIDDFMPLKSLPDDRGQSSPDYQRWLELSAELGRNYFERGSPIFNAIHHSSHRVIAAAMKDIRSDSILDLGSGTGAHFPYYESLDNVIGLDVNLSALESSKRDFPGSQLMLGDAYCLPFKPASFDTILSVYNLEHVFHLDAALENVKRVLKPDGYFFVGLPCEGGLVWNSGRAMTSGRTIPKLYGIDYAKVIAIEHCNTADKVVKGLRKHFKIERQTYFPAPFLPSLNLNFTTTLICRQKS